MKITKNQLKHIIQEELAYALSGEEDAYNSWSKNRLETTGKESPTYEEYLSVRSELDSDALYGKDHKQNLAWDQGMGPGGASGASMIDHGYGSGFKGREVDAVADAMKARGIDFDAQNK